MLANPSMFHVLIDKKDQTNISGKRIKNKTGGKTNESEDSVKLLGIQRRYTLNFDPHISELCRKAATQLNVPTRLRSYLASKRE